MINVNIASGGEIGFTGWFRLSSDLPWRKIESTQNANQQICKKMTHDVANDWIELTGQVQTVVLADGDDPNIAI